MGSRWLLRVLSVVCAFAFAAALSRAASAAAPICDDRAASAIAPPPMAALGGHAWDTDCIEVCFVCIPFGVSLVRPADAPSVILERNALDPSLAPPDEPAIAHRPAKHHSAEPPRLAPLSGHYPSVFRPPRTGMAV